VQEAQHCQKSENENFGQKIFFCAKKLKIWPKIKISLNFKSHFPILARVETGKW